MKQYKKITAFLGVLALAAAPSFAQQIPGLEKIKGNLDELAGDFARGLAFNAGLGLWSDAYIGSIVGVPPHFGVGINAGVTTIKSTAFKGLLSDLGESDSSLTGLLDGLGLPLPAALVSARVGGLVLPFDVGIKGMYLPSISLGEIRSNYVFFGLDVRYALIKDSGVLPAVSIGLGYTYVGGGLGLPIGQEQNINFNGQTVKFDRPELTISWGNSSVDLNAQVSKKLLIITPFLGIGASYGFSQVEFGVKGTVQANDGLKKIAEQFGFDLDSQGITSTIKGKGLSVRIYGGTSFDIAFIRLNLGVLYSPFGNNFGADFGIRFQL
ncbi:MAG: hypothetical protein LBE17_11495 [Treponema sp.]|nr:hypothetical protein [Treponema sp.]